MKRIFKLTVCLSLIIALLIALTAPAGARGESDSLSVFVASDIHYRPPGSLPPIGEVKNLPSDALFSHANTKGMLTYEADAIIDAFLSSFEASEAKYLLIPGDISEDGFWDEHLSIAKKLKEFKQRTGKKIFLIPGNHDIRTSDSQNRLNLSDFLEVYADIGYDEALVRHEGTASYTAELENGYRLIAIDACIYRQDGSAVSPQLLSWIEQQAHSAKSDGKKLIGMVHHSVLEHFGVQSIGGNLLCLDGYMELATQFADWGIKYFFTGHEHANDISSAVSANGNRIFDIETCSLITYPNAYREVSFSDTQVKIETKYVDKIDLSLLPDGYSDEQLELLERDFPAYSYEYFKAGFKSYAYELPGLTKKLADKLKVESPSTAYTAISDIMALLCRAASLPMYDTAGTPEADSIEEVAKRQGFTIDKSDYDNVLDLAASIYAGHYAGDEALDFDSPEIRLLSHGLNCVLVYAFMNVPVTTANTLFTAMGLPAFNFSILDTLYTARQTEIYMKRAANVILKNMLEPAANGIINDISAPADNNVTLEPYASTGEPEGQGVAISEAANFINIFLKILKAMLKTVKAILFF